MQDIGMHISFWITLGVLGAGVIVFGVGVWLLMRAALFDDWREPAGDVLVFSGGAAAAIAAFILVASLIPFKPEYWPMYRVEGQVTSVSNVLSEDGGDLTRTPIVTLDSFNQPLAVDDPRAVTLQGQRVALICNREWVYQGADRYSCRIANL